MNPISQFLHNRRIKRIQAEQELQQEIEKEREEWIARLRKLWDDQDQKKLEDHRHYVSCQFFKNNRRQSSKPL